MKVIELINLLEAQEDIDEVFLVNADGVQFEPVTVSDDFYDSTEHGTVLPIGCTVILMAKSKS